MHFYTHCVLACVLLYPIQSVKNYIQLRLNVYLCHVFNNTKIKAFLSCCCILCSRMPEHWFRHLTLMEKSSPLNLSSGTNIEWNSPLHTFKHYERIKRHLIVVIADHHQFYSTSYQFCQHTEQLSGKKPQHNSSLKTNAFVVIKVM